MNTFTVDKATAEQKIDSESKQVSKAEAALKEAGVETKVKLGPLPFIAGMSVKARQPR